MTCPHCNYPTCPGTAWEVCLIGDPKTPGLDDVSPGSWRDRRVPREPGQQSWLLAAVVFRYCDSSVFSWEVTAKRANAIMIRRGPSGHLSQVA